MRYTEPVSGIQLYYDNQTYNPHYTQPDVILLADTILQTKPAGQRVRVLDYGCGSGVLGLAVAKLHPITLDIYEPDRHALRIARLNAKRNGVPVEAVSRIDREYHLILANLPTYDPGQLAAEPLHGPLLAYDGGADGLAAYRELLSHPAIQQSVVVAECQSARQAAFVALAEELGWTDVMQLDQAFALMRLNS